MDAYYERGIRSFLPVMHAPGEDVIAVVCVVARHVVGKANDWEGTGKGGDRIPGEIRLRDRQVEWSKGSTLGHINCRFS